MIPRRAKSFFRDKPAGREDDKVGDCRARCMRWGGEDGEDGGVRVVIRYAADSVEAAEVVFVRIVSSMPGYNIERSVPL